MVGSDYSFTASDLLRYAEDLIKEARFQEMSLAQSNYAWLKSRHLDTSAPTKDLDKLKPLIEKMKPESCAAIAVKLDSLDQMPSRDILIKLRSLLEERDSMQIMNEMRNVRRGRKKYNRVNRVHPDLSMMGREPTVSFIL